MIVRLAAVQPRSGGGAEEARNAREALDWLDRAAAAGADLVLFPEGYPGPVNPANSYDAFGPLAERAARHRLHVLASRVGAVAGGYAVELHLIDDEGRTAGIYRRTTPTGPYVYRDIPAWDFDYVAAPAPPRVVRTRLGRIGMLVCSELYTPELSRLLAIEGADIILYPAGGAINEFLPGWRTLVWARAIENLVFTAACQNLYGDEEGVGTIAAPEGVLTASPGEGLLIADLDMARLAFLRGEDEKIEFPKRYNTIPGVLRWRRPELYGALAAPAATAGADRRTP
ncbi:MAG: carbon-nitrogen hydrolase family protein [Burkholderiales bacterium]|nr:carbon-nitrogen hydrolase family protein [Burkholderiales bacterium]